MVALNTANKIEDIVWRLLERRWVRIDVQVPQCSVYVKMRFLNKAPNVTVQCLTWQTILKEGLLETGVEVGYFQITISEKRKWSFHNRVFLSRVYRLIVTPRKFVVLKTNNNPISEASRFYMSVLRTSNFQRAINYKPMRPETNTPLFLLFNAKRFSHKTCPFESSVHQVWVFKDLKWKAA